MRALDSNVALAIAGIGPIKPGTCCPSRVSPLPQISSTSERRPGRLEPSDDLVYKFWDILCPIYSQIRSFTKKSFYLHFRGVLISGIYFGVGHASIQEALPSYVFLNINENQKNRKRFNN